MPLPLIIPIAIGGAALLTGGGLTLNAQGKIKKAKAEYQTAYNAYKVKYEHYQAYHAGTERRLQELGQARATGMKAVREAIDFIRKARLVNPNIISDGQVNIADMERLDQAYGDILKSLGGAGSSLAGGIGFGALTALGTYGAVGVTWVGAAASTGTAISGLSGAALSSATLAWLGGGAIGTSATALGMAGGTAVLGGIVAAPAIIGFGVFRQVKAGKVQNEAAEKIRQVEVKEAEIDRDRVKLRTVRQRCDEVQRTVRELTGQLKTALSSASPNIPEDAQRIVRISKTLRAAIDEPVVPANQRGTTRSRRSSGGSAIKTCAIADCHRQATVGDYCTGHRKNAHQQSANRSRHSNGGRATKTCAVADCRRQATVNYYCTVHYKNDYLQTANRFRHPNGSRATKTCAATGCLRQSTVRDYCTGHRKSS